MTVLICRRSSNRFCARFKQ